MGNMKCEGCRCPDCTQRWENAAAQAWIIEAREKAAFVAGWNHGYYDGGEHDCRMFSPTAERAWEDWREQGETR